jgi:hypothetical protein
MTSVMNLFSNFNDLTKSKSINDSASDYKSKKIDLNTPTPALSQGEKFKKYQGKIKKNLDKKINAVNTREGFEGLDKIDENIKLNHNGLTVQSNNIIQNNDYSSQQQTITNLQQQYQNTLSQYQNLVSQIQGATSGYLNRVNPSNPYLNKTVRFTTGHIAYVTNQGAVKYIPTVEIWNSVKAPQQYTQLNIPWDDSWNNNPGIVIPTDPPLVSGTFMQLNQSLGNEGSNVFVNSLVNNANSSYVGCYNNVAPVTNIMFVPVMNSSNTSNGYTSRASSIYLNDSPSCGWGPWAAFDRNAGDFWHSQVSASTDYNASTGVYEGINGWDYHDANGNSVHAAGEWLWMESGPGNVLTKYDVQGRQGCCGANGITGRTPNSWVIIGGVYNQAYELIDKQENQNFNYELKTYIVNNPKKYNHFIFVTTNCGNPSDNTGNRYCVQIAQWNLYTSSNLVGEQDSAMTNVGQMTFQQCQNYAVSSGNKYFGLQGVDDSGVGNCMVRGDLTGSEMYGEGLLYTGVPLWASNTAASETDNPGSTATIDSTGALTVYNSSGTAVYQSPPNQATTAGSSDGHSPSPTTLIHKKNPDGLEDESKLLR